MYVITGATLKKDGTQKSRLLLDELESRGDSFGAPPVGGGDGDGEVEI